MDFCILPPLSLRFPFKAILPRAPSLLARTFPLPYQTVGSEGTEPPPINQTGANTALSHSSSYIYLLYCLLFFLLFETLHCGFVSVRLFFSSLFFSLSHQLGKLPPTLRSLPSLPTSSFNPSLNDLSVGFSAFLVLSNPPSQVTLRVAHMIALQKPALLPSAKVDISLLLKPQDEEDDGHPRTAATTYHPRPVLSAPTVPPMTVASPGPATVSSLPANKIPAASIPAKRLQPTHPAESPAKKQSKWSPEEDSLIIELRGSGMKWEDISRRLPGRSAISCRLHYQNYLERRSEWDEDKKNKLARLYERYVLCRKESEDFVLFNY